MASVVTLNKRWDSRRLVCDFAYEARLGRTPQMPSCFWRKWKLLSHVWLFATAWTGACPGYLPMAFPRQEYGGGLPFSSPGGLPNPGIELRSPALQADFSLSESPEKPYFLRGKVFFSAFFLVCQAPGRASGKEATYQCTRHKRCGFDLWVVQIPWRRAWQPTAVILAWRIPWERNPAGYSP